MAFTRLNPEFILQEQKINYQLANRRGFFLTNHFLTFSIPYFNKALT